MRKKKTFKQWSPGTGITSPIHREMLEKKSAWDAIYWDGVTDGLSMVTVSDVPYYKVAESTGITEENLKGSTYGYFNSSNSNVNYYGTTIDDSGMGYIFCAEFCILIITDVNNPPGIKETGVYFVGNSMMHITALIPPVA